MQAQALPAASLVKAVRDLLYPPAASNEIERLVAALKRTDICGVATLKPLKVKILGNITTNYLADYVRLMLVRAGFGAVVEAGHYGGLVRGALGEVDLSPASCDAAIFILTHRDLQFPPSLGIDATAARELVAREAGFWNSILGKSKVPTVALLFDLPQQRVLDEQDGLTPGGLGWHIRMTNLELAASLPATVSCVDAEALQSRVGADAWHDFRLYHLCKQPFSMEALPEISHTLVSALVGLQGRARKVLILDLDNTLWGGVIGDDGLQGIDLGPETPDGEAFSTFQTYLKNLSRRGVVLAVCSKNRDEVARSPFREHSGMVLKEEDISCFVANFQDKASNIRDIARTLNLGLDSFVFVDDNPVERTLIRSELPEVLVVELPEDPACYSRAVEASKAFPMRSLTREDLGRAASYRAMSIVRETSNAAGTDMEQFLIGLEPTVHIEKINESTVDRIVQLIRKTNQFKLNLTTFLENEILENADGVVALRLADRLQDYGIVAIAVARKNGASLEILNWVMSCRVFGRRLENMMVEALCRMAGDWNCTALEAPYTATEKNIILPEILSGLGFSLAGLSGTYVRPVDPELSAPHHMTIVDRR